MSRTSKHQRTPFEEAIGAAARASDSRMLAILYRRAKLSTEKVHAGAVLAIHLRYDGRERAARQMIKLARSFAADNYRDLVYLRLVESLFIQPHLTELPPRPAAGQ